MVVEKNIKIGVVSCSGEDCLGGTISRMATRKMVEENTSYTVATLCLPLFLAGGEEERGFARKYPTIALEGCSKYCAKRATEKYSGKVSDVLNVADFIGDEMAESKLLSTRNLTDEHMEMVNQVLGELRKKLDVIAEDYAAKGSEREATGNCGCSCGGNK